MLAAAPTRRARRLRARSGCIELARNKPEDKEATYNYRFSIATNGSADGAGAPTYPLSERVKYWCGVFNDSLKECVALKPNSDMGLCQLVRLLYRYGTLPAALGRDGDLTWRRRLPPDDTFTHVLRRAGDGGR